jgi:hypothetical protein
MLLHWCGMASSRPCSSSRVVAAGGAGNDCGASQLPLPLWGRLLLLLLVPLVVLEGSCPFRVLLLLLLLLLGALLLLQCGAVCGCLGPAFPSCCCCCCCCCCCVHEVHELPCGSVLC